MVDEHTRESLLDITDRSIASEKVIAHLKTIIAQRRALLVQLCDNGSEYISHALNEFAFSQLGIHYIPPGQPSNNGYVESLNKRVLDECLDMNGWNTFTIPKRSLSNRRGTTPRTTATQS
jgi:transposase InsO family protein